jgi:hypothetical protein
LFLEPASWDLRATNNGVHLLFVTHKWSFSFIVLNFYREHFLSYTLHTHTHIVERATSIV